VAVITTRRDPVSTSGGIPRSLGPLDGGPVAPRSSLHCGLITVRRTTASPKRSGASSVPVAPAVDADLLKLVIFDLAKSYKIKLGHWETKRFPSTGTSRISYNIAPRDVGS